MSGSKEYYWTQDCEAQKLLESKPDRWFLQYDHQQSKARLTEQEFKKYSVDVFRGKFNKIKNDRGLGGKYFIDMDSI